MEFLSSDVVVVAGRAGISALRAHRHADPGQPPAAPMPRCLQLGQALPASCPVFGK
jgi:hypothetical protein